MICLSKWIRLPKQYPPTLLSCKARLLPMQAYRKSTRVLLLRKRTQSDERAPAGFFVCRIESNQRKRFFKRETHSFKVRLLWIVFYSSEISASLPRWGSSGSCVLFTKRNFWEEVYGFNKYRLKWNPHLRTFIAARVFCLFLRANRVSNGRLSCYLSHPIGSWLLSRQRIFSIIHWPAFSSN